MFGNHRRWFGAAAYLNDAELRDLDLRALRADAARAAVAGEAAAKRQQSLRRHARQAFRRIVWGNKGCRDTLAKRRTCGGPQQ